jgi:hypothetical protein
MIRIFLRHCIKWIGQLVMSKKKHYSVRSAGCTFFISTYNQKP